MAISGVLVFSLNMYVVTFAVIDPHQLTRGAIGEDHCDLCLVYIVPLFSDFEVCSESREYFRTGRNAPIANHSRSIVLHFMCN